MPFIAPESDKKKPTGAPKTSVVEQAPAKGFTAPASDRPMASRQDAMVPRDQWQSGLKATLGVAPEPAPASGPAEYINAASRATAPVATFAGGGAAIGTMLGGPLGAIPGAIAGATTLALGDVGAYLIGEGVQLFDPNFNFTGPSDAIRAGLDATGLTRVPSADPGVQTFNAGMEMAAQAPGAGAITNFAAKSLAPVVPSFVRPVANFMATPTPAAVNIGGGFGAGALEKTASYQTDDPLLRFGAGVVGGVLGGAGGSMVESAVKAPFKPRAPTAAGLSAAMDARYQAAHAADVQWTPDKVRAATQTAASEAVSTARGGQLAPSAAAHPIIKAQLDDLEARASNSPSGTLTSRELELWRKDFRRATAPLTDDYRIAATRILESIDEFGTNPQTTLNALRGNVVSSGQQAYDIVDRARSAQDAARAAASNAARAEAAFNAVPATDVAGKRAATDALTAARAAQAAAQKQADDLVAPSQDAMNKFKSSVDEMVKTDPAMRGVANAHDAAVRKAAAADMAATQADVRYSSLASQTMAAEAEELAAKQAYEAAKVKYANNPKTFAANTSRTKKASEAAAARAAELRNQTDEALKRRDAADNARSVAETRRNSALTDMRKRQIELAKVETDAAAKSAKRTSNMAAARGTYPDYLNAAQFEAMPAAARVARGNTRNALQNQVRAFINQDGGYEFQRLPAATQRELERFARGGSVTEKTMNFIGDFLTPGFGGRNLFGTALGAINTAGAASGAGLIPLAAQLATGYGLKGAANAMAGQGFNRVRDMVAYGTNLPPQVPQNIVSAAVRNAMLAQGTNDRGQ